MGENNQMPAPRKLGCLFGALDTNNSNVRYIRMGKQYALQFSRRYWSKPCKSGIVLHHQALVGLYLEIPRWCQTGRHQDRYFRSIPYTWSTPCVDQRCNKNLQSPWLQCHLFWTNRLELWHLESLLGCWGNPGNFKDTAGIVKERETHLHDIWSSYP